MNLAEQQSRIEQIAWYHEFDFGNGLKSRSPGSYAPFHRRIWRFLEQHLDAIDFRNKTVLDIGCWDGYWSFYAERRGAKRVLATDDLTQNWSDGRGLLLARELYGSAVEVNQGLSIYQLASLNCKFDIILCLGVHYHLLDPLYAYAQIRHCCHRDTLVLFEGVEAVSLPPHGIHFDPYDHANEFLPSSQALGHMLRAAYLSECSAATLAALLPTETPPATVPSAEAPPAAPSPAETPPPGRLGWRWRLRMCCQAMAGCRHGVQTLARMIEPIPESPERPEGTSPKWPKDVGGVRTFRVCTPLEGINPVHCYKPPFGLHIYDDRYREKTAA